MNLMQQLAAFQFTPNALPMQVDHPIWGNASIDEIVDVQMGAMGITKL